MMVAVKRKGDEMITLNQELLSIVQLINSQLTGEDLLLFVMALERAGVFEAVNVDGKTQWRMAPEKRPPTSGTTFGNPARSPDRERAGARTARAADPQLTKGRGFPTASRSGRAVDHL